MYAKESQYESSCITLWLLLEPLAMGCSGGWSSQAIVHCTGYSEVIVANHLQNSSLSLFRFFSESLSLPPLYHKTPNSDLPPFEAHTAILSSSFLRRYFAAYYHHFRQARQ
jgi:hypothetical protein